MTEDETVEGRGCSEQAHDSVGGHEEQGHDSNSENARTQEEKGKG